MFAQHIIYKTGNPFTVCENTVEQCIERTKYMTERDKDNILAVSIPYIPAEYNDGRAVYLNCGLPEDWREFFSEALKPAENGFELRRFKAFIPDYAKYDVLARHKRNHHAAILAKNHPGTVFSQRASNAYWNRFREDCEIQSDQMTWTTITMFAFGFVMSTLCRTTDNNDCDTLSSVFYYAGVGTLVLALYKTFQVLRVPFRAP